MIRSPQTQLASADRRSLVNDIVGDGYDFSGTFSTFRKPKTLAIASIEKIAGAGNHTKQRQIADALIEHYQSGGGELRGGRW